MKIYIKSSEYISCSRPSEQPWRSVVRAAIKLNNRLATQVETILHGIAIWKSYHSLQMHHGDGNYTNQSPNNLIFIRGDAHTYISKLKNSDILSRALHNESEYFPANKGQAVYPSVLTQLSHTELFVRNSLETILECLSKNLSHLDTPESVCDILDNSGIHGVNQSDIDKFIADSGIDINAEADVMRIDSDVADRLLEFLEILSKEYSLDKGNMHRNSVALLQSFIRRNTVTPKELSDQYYAGVWKHSGARN